MSINKNLIKKEVNALLIDAQYLLYSISIKHNKISDDVLEELKNNKLFQEFQNKNPNHQLTYQAWYTKTLNVIKTVIPERFKEFVELYNLEKRNVSNIDFVTYTISDFFRGVSVTRGWHKEEVVNPFSAFHSKFHSQITILNSSYEILDSKLLDIEGVLQYELFENELQASKDLLAKKYNRASGALAGVTLEIHLNSVCKNHNLTFRKQNPTISDFNESLKNEKIIDTATWRLIQRLGDIRNMSVHSKDREPTKDEVEDLIRGIEKLISELY